MNEHREKELFRTLGNLVGGVKKIQQTLEDHTKTLDEHTGILKSLVSKTNSIAEQVMENDQRLTARILSVENAIENLGGAIH